MTDHLGTGQTDRQSARPAGHWLAANRPVLVAQLSYIPADSQAAIAQIARNSGRMMTYTCARSAAAG